MGTDGEREVTFCESTSSIGYLGKHFRGGKLDEETGGKGSRTIFAIRRRTPIYRIIYELANRTLLASGATNSRVILLVHFNIYVLPVTKRVGTATRKGKRK